MLVLNGLPLGVVPVLIGPIQVLIAVAPAILAAIGSTLLLMFRPSVIKQGLRLLWRQKIQVGLVVALIWGAVAGVRALGARGVAGVDEDREEAEDWPMFQGGVRRLGIVPGTPSPTTGGEVWSYRQGDHWFLATGAVTGNRVYVVSAGGLGVLDRADGVGVISCLDADTGEVVWSVTPRFPTGFRTFRATFSSPVVVGDTLLVGEGTHLTRGARVVALDTRDGSLRWYHETVDHVEATPVVYGGRVFVGAGDLGGIRCLDLETGELLWHLPGETYEDAETSMVADGDRVIAGLGVDGHAIVILDTETGDLRRWIDTKYPVFSPGAVADGKLYIGMGNGDFVNEGEPPAGELWRVDLARAEQDPEYTHDWKVQVSHTILGAVALGDRHAYVATRRGQVLAVDRETGAIAREWDAHAPIMASPALTEDILYVVTRTGMLYGLDRETFEPVWQFPVGSQPSVHDPGVLSSPVIARGRVYIGTQREGFRAVGEPDRGQIPVWDGELGGPGLGGNPLRTAVPGLGGYAWSWPAGLEGETDTVVVAAPPAVMGTRVVVPVARPSGAGAPTGLTALQPGDARTGPGSPLWIHEEPAGIHHSPAIVGDGDTAAVYALTGQAGQEAPRALIALGLADGALRWTTPVGADAPGLLRATPDLVLAGAEAETLAAWSPDGERLWSRPLGPLRGISQVDQHRVAAVTDLTLTLLDAPTGAVLWTAPLGASGQGFVRLDGLRVLVATAAGVQAHSLVDGSVLPAEAWSPPARGVGSPVILSRHHLAYVSDDHHLILLRRDTGLPAAAPFGPVYPGLPPMVSGDDLLVTAPDGSVQTVSLDGEASPDRVLRATPWADASWIGAPAAPAVFFRTGILAPRAGWGLVSLEAGR